MGFIVFIVITWTSHVYTFTALNALRPIVPVVFDNLLYYRCSVFIAHCSILGLLFKAGITLSSWGSFLPWVSGMLCCTATALQVYHIQFVIRGSCFPLFVILRPHTCGFCLGVCIYWCLLNILLCLGTFSYSTIVLSWLARPLTGSALLPSWPARPLCGLRPDVLGRPTALASWPSVLVSLSLALRASMYLQWSVLYLSMQWPSTWSMD